MADAHLSSLIAVMLGRFRMTVDEATKEYHRFANQIFENPKPLYQLHYKYRRKPLQKAIESVIKRRSRGNDVEEPFRQRDYKEDSPRSCLT